VQGDRGLLTWLRLKQELAEAQTAEAHLSNERAAMARRVRLLRPDNLDPDMLAERAHAVLNYGRGDEYIVLLPKEERDAE
jgi:cell division protein FtsB